MALCITSRFKADHYFLLFPSLFFVYYHGACLRCCWANIDLLMVPIISTPAENAIIILFSSNANISPKQYRTAIVDQNFIVLRLLLSNQLHKRKEGVGVIKVKRQFMHNAKEVVPLYSSTHPLGEGIAAFLPLSLIGKSFDYYLWLEKHIN